MNEYQRLGFADDRSMNNNSNVCSECKMPIVKPIDSCAAGYARRADDSIICYPCADAEQRTQLRDRSSPYAAYVDANASRVTTWTGGELGTIHAWCTHKIGFNRSQQCFFRVRDVHGAWWRGRGAGKGMFCTLRPMKDPR